MLGAISLGIGFPKTFGPSIICRNGGLQFALLKPYLPRPRRKGRPRRPARSPQRNLLPAPHRLPVAAAPQGLPAREHRPHLVPSLGQGRHLGEGQRGTAPAGPPAGRPRPQPALLGRRQPVGEDGRPERGTRLRQRQEGQGPQAPHLFHAAGQFGSRRSGREVARHLPCLFSLILRVYRDAHSLQPAFPDRHSNDSLPFSSFRPGGRRYCRLYFLQGSCAPSGAGPRRPARVRREPTPATGLSRRESSGIVCPDVP